MQLRASEDLVVEVDEDGTTRIGRGTSTDWFGPARPTGVASVGVDDKIGQLLSESDDMGDYTALVVADDDVRCSIRAYKDRSMVVFRTEATRDLDELSTGSYDRPSAGWPVFKPADRRSGGAPEGLRALAFQQCEFGLPSTAGVDLDGFFLLPHRPPTGWPLILGAEDGTALLLAPLDNFHDQVVGLNGGTVRCGWNGDIDSVTSGFTTDLAVISGSGPRECLDIWGTLLLERAGTVRPGRWADALASRPSYWTDNGAAYWYRTEPGHDVAGSIVAAVDDLCSKDVPIGAVQLDSWFYPHEDLRPFDTDEWVVPPSALTAWEERKDVLPDGISDLRDRLGGPPLVAHIRHLSADATITAEYPVYVDGDYAAPSTPEIYERWLDQCLAWGVETFEHDWLVEVFFGVRGLRERPGRARAWQEGIDRAARDRGITLQWCMGTPADFAQTTTLTQVTSVRTCGDHGYIATAGQLWAWFCTTNALARSLGLMPFKDVFRADPEVAGDNGPVEALLSSLSTGPVGLGDRVGRMDPALAMQTCRADGLLIKPDVPVAAVDASMLGAPAFAPELLVAECYSDHPAGRWVYALGMHANPGDAEVSGEIALADLGDLTDLGDSAPVGEVVVWDWRAGTVTHGNPQTRLPVTLPKEGWTYFVVAPVLAASRLAVIGDVSKFVPAGDARIVVETLASEGRLGRDDVVRVTVKGAGETVTLTGWAASPVTATVLPADGHPAELGGHWDPQTRIWTLPVVVGSRGWVTVELRV
ncbi:MAG: hypothetical protein WBA45_15360 [Microthrixaceae bacterium]